MQPERQQADLNTLVAAKQALGENICTAIAANINKLGLDATQFPQLKFDNLQFSLQRDPYTQQDTLEGLWKGAQQNRIGSILFHGDGSFFAEFDVVQVHPRKPGWFVEKITAWGNGEMLKTEAELLPMPE